MGNPEMADLSIYLFWTGLTTAIIAVVLYIAYAASASISLRRYAAQTSAGTVTMVSGSGQPNAPLGRLATTTTGVVVLALGAAVATRWVAVGHAPISNLYEFTVAFAFGMAAAYLGFETYSGMRRLGLVGLPIVLAMLLVATRFPTDIVPLIPALQNGPLLAIHVATMMVSYSVLTVAFSGVPSRKRCAAAKASRTRSAIAVAPSIVVPGRIAMNSSPP